MGSLPTPSARPRLCQRAHATPREHGGPALSDDAAVFLPPKHCAFNGCAWSAQNGEQLLEHASVDHSGLLSQVTELVPTDHSLQERVWSAYNEAIAVVVRRGAPLAAYSIDRRSLRNYVASFEGDGVQQLVCFSCARRFPHISSWKNRPSGYQQRATAV